MTIARCSINDTGINDSRKSNSVTYGSNQHHSQIAGVLFLRQHPGTPSEPVLAKYYPPPSPPVHQSRVINRGHHESNELFKVDAALTAADIKETLFHLILLIIHPQTRQRSSKFLHLERIVTFPVKMQKHSFKFLELIRRQIRRVARHNLGSAPKQQKKKGIEGVLVLDSG